VPYDLSVCLFIYFSHKRCVLSYNRNVTLAVGRIAATCNRVRWRTLGTALGRRTMCTCAAPSRGYLDPIRIHDTLGLHESTTQTRQQSVQLFFHNSPVCSTYKQTTLYATCDMCWNRPHLHTSCGRCSLKTNRKSHAINRTNLSARPQEVAKRFIKPKHRRPQYLENQEG